MPKPQRILVTAPQLAAMWGLGRTKVTAWMRAGKLGPVYNLANSDERPQLRVRLEDAEAFLRSRQVVKPVVTPRRKRGERVIIPY